MWLVRHVLRSRRVVVAVDEVAHDRRTGLAAVGVDEALAVGRHRRGLVLPRSLAEHHHARAEIGGRQHRVGRHGDAVGAVLERARRRRAGSACAVAGSTARRPRCRRSRARRGSCGAASSKRSRDSSIGDAEAGVLAAGQAAAHAEQHAAVRQVVEQRRSSRPRAAARSTAGSPHRCRAGSAASAPPCARGTRCCPGRTSSRRSGARPATGRGSRARRPARRAGSPRPTTSPSRDLVLVAPRLEDHLHADSHVGSVGPCTPRRCGALAGSREIEV